MNRRRAGILFHAAALLLCLYFIRPAFEWFNGKGGAHDWDAQTFYLEAALRPVLAFGELPAWNPWYGGGLPQAANPQAKPYSPTWLFGLVLGALNGHKIAVIFYYLLGTWSMMFLLQDVLRLRGPAALCGTTLFVFAGSIPLRVLAGHTTFLCILVYPLVIALFILGLRARGPRSLLFAGASAAVLSAMYSEGYHAVMLFLPGAGFTLLAYAIAVRRPGILGLGAMAMLFFAFLSAHRLVPQVQYMLETGAHVFPDASFLTPDALRAIFLDAVSDPAARKWPGQKYLWWEYGTYIGWTSLVAMPFLLVFTRRRHLALWVVLLFLLLLIAGRFASFAPAAWLGLLPLYENLRGWARFSMAAVLVWSVLYAILLHRLLVFAAGRPSRAWRTAAAGLVTFLLLWSFYDLRIINARRLSGVFTLEIPAGKPAPRLKTISALPPYGANSAMLPALRRNLSTRDAYEMLKSNRTAKADGEPGYRGEFHLESSGRVIHPTRETPRELGFDFIAKRGDVLLMNRNYHSGWRARHGYVIENRRGLMAVRVKAGRNQITVRYEDRATNLLLYLSAALHGLLVGTYLLLRKDGSPER